MNQVESTLASLFGEIADGICVSDISGRIMYLNASAERMLRISLPDAKNQFLCDLLCARLSTRGGDPCESICPLRHERNGPRAVSFQGRYNRGYSFEWKSPRLQHLKQ